jgi:putative ABC transport system ATP-binding protein
MFEQPGSSRGKIEKARELLERLGVGHLMHKTPTVMSGGERQRVAIARALANDPAILLGDEPTGDVDTKTGEQIMTVLKDLHKKQGMTLIVVTHAPDVAKQAERIIELKDGKVFRR